MLVLTLLLSIGCAPSLDGDWDGPLDCGSGTVEVLMELELEADGSGQAEGEGRITFTESTGIDRELTFDVQVSASAASPLASEVDVAMDLDDCRYDGRIDDCNSVKDAAWDRGDDVLTGDIDSFLTAWDCDFELER